MLPGSLSLRGARMSSAGKIWLQTRPGGWPAPEQESAAFFLFLVLWQDPNQC
jgi:hypothetical protein